MDKFKIFSNWLADFATKDDALNHIGQFLTQQGMVKDTFSQAIIDREAEFPTGIDLGFGGVAIPHCDATHAITPCMYLIKTANPVSFIQATGDEISTNLIIALVVTDPQDQIKLLTNLFKGMQDQEFYNGLINSTDENTMVELFKAKVLV